MKRINIAGLRISRSLGQWLISVGPIALAWSERTDIGWQQAFGVWHEKRNSEPKFIKVFGPAV